MSIRDLGLVVGGGLLSSAVFAVVHDYGLDTLSRIATPLLEALFPLFLFFAALFVVLFLFFVALFLVFGLFYVLLRCCCFTSDDAVSGSAPFSSLLFSLFLLVSFLILCLSLLEKGSKWVDSETTYSWKYQDSRTDLTATIGMNEILKSRGVVFFLFFSLLPLSRVFYLMIQTFLKNVMATGRSFSNRISSFVPLVTFLIFSAPLMTGIMVGMMWFSLVVDSATTTLICFAVLIASTLKVASKCQKDYKTRKKGKIHRRKKKRKRNKKKILPSPPFLSPSIYCIF